MLLLHVPIGGQASETLADLLLAWQLEPLPSAVLLVLGALYAVGRRRLRAQHGHDPRGGGYFVGAYLALALALLSPLHSFSAELFAFHMVQHVLLMSVAAPLLLLANPMPVLLWGLPPGGRRGLGRVLSPDAPLLRVLKVLTLPLLAWWLFVLCLWLWHLPAAYQAALGNEGVHYLQHALFFVSAVLFWWPVIGPAPLRSRLGFLARMLYVFAAWLPNSVLGALITFAPAPLFDFYVNRPRHWGIDPLSDQQLAGLLMWIPGDLIYAAAMLVLLMAIVRQEDRREAGLTASPS